MDQTINIGALKVAFGKYKDTMTYEELVEKDIDYASWMTTVMETESVKSWLLEKLAGHWRVPFGKYKGLTYEELVEKDGKYAEWFSTVLKDKSARIYLNTLITASKS